MNNSQDDVMLRGSDEFGTATYHISSFHCIMRSLQADRFRPRGSAVIVGPAKNANKFTVIVKKNFDNA